MPDYIELSITNEDGSKSTYKLALYQEVTPPDPPDPPDVLPIAASVMANSLAVRSEPFIRGGNDTVITRLQKDQNIFIDRLADGIEHDTAYEWGMNVLDINGTRIGDYVAIRETRANGTQFLDLEETKLNPPKVGQYPTVSRQYDAKIFNSVQIDGNNSRQQIGVNMRRAAWMLDGNGAVIDSELAANGITKNRLIEELNRINKPNWSGQEPYYGHLIRIYAKNSKYSNAQALINLVEFLTLLGNYRDGNGIPYLRVIICLTDTFKAWPGMYFKEYDAFHTGPKGKTNTLFWTSKAYTSHLAALIQQIVRPLASQFPDLIFGWQIMNETALDVPATATTVNAYIEGVQYLAKLIWEQSEGRHHIMTGLRTGHDIYQSAMTSLTFYNQLLSSDGKYITMLNFHPYCKQPPIQSTRPEDLFEEWPWMKADVDRARDAIIPRPIIADEMGSWIDGWQPSHLTQRDQADKAALEYLQHQLGVYACLEWEQQLTVTYDSGYGDNSRGLNAVRKINGVQTPVTSTPGVVKVLHDHAQENYRRG